MEDEVFKEYGTLFDKYLHVIGVKLERRYVKKSGRGIERKINL